MIALKKFLNLLGLLALFLCSEAFVSIAYAQDQAVSKSTDSKVRHIDGVVVVVVEGEVVLVEDDVFVDVVELLVPFDWRILLFKNP